MEPRLLKMLSSAPGLLLSLVLAVSSGTFLSWSFQLDALPLSPVFLWTEVKEDFVCAKPNYTTRILMYDPFMMHIENFITPDERAHLIKLGEPDLQPSKILLDNGTEAFDEVRTSRSAFLPRTDHVSMCIMQRAAEIQGYIDTKNIEELQVTAYAQGQRYYPHFDWFEPGTLVPPTRPNRASTFFATLEADCENCGTRFPRLEAHLSGRDEKLCRIIDCEGTEGLTVHATPGAAVFWRNLNSSGVGNERTLHEGLPLTEGSKIGLNIWTRGK